MSGLEIPCVFSDPYDRPFDDVVWEKRTAEIKAADSSIVFRQENVEVPASWSQLATNIVASKYFYGEQGTPERETSVRQLIDRVVSTIQKWGDYDGYFNTPVDSVNFANELEYLCVNQYGSFNSPVWFNVGVREKPQTSACFLQSVDDNMESIMDLAKSEAMLFKYGSGTGTDLTPLRSSKEKLTGGGKPSGPVSFMKLYDTIGGIIKSGGKTRRAARLNCLQVTHPDIMEFIECKVKEERKAKALIDAGYDADFNGEAYSTVAFQNTNISVRVTDEFMKSIDEGFNFYTFNSSDGKECERIDPDKILTKMAESAWECGDPGIQYHDTLNAWHTVPNSGSQNTSNPCGEIVTLDDLSCNLASINLMKFRLEDGSFDVNRFRAAVRIFIVAQDILIDRSSYPTEKITQKSRDFRPLGLGYANLGAYIMSLGLPYDSEEARSLAACVTALMSGEAYRMSSEIAKIKGAFKGFELNREPMLKVMMKHRDSLNNIEIQENSNLINCFINACGVWEIAYKNAEEVGFRNNQISCCAPTGTIGFMMDCDTTGIEPELALVKHKSLAGGGSLKLVNQTVPMALEKLGYDKARADRIVDYIAGEHGANSPPGLLEKDKAVFDCSFPGINGRSIAPSGHIKMMAAVQPFLSGAISKTVNMPYDSTVEDIKEAYMEGWRLGLKSLSIYRDGSKGSQPLNTKKDEKYKFKRYLIDPVGETTMEYSDRNDYIEFPKFCPDSPVRSRLPMTRKSITHKFDIQGHEGYIHVGMYDDGRPGEMFITMAKQGSTVSGLMDALATSVSISLQYGIPLSVLTEKLKHTRYEPCGFTKNTDIPITSSICDYIFRWMEQQFNGKPLIDIADIDSSEDFPEDGVYAPRHLKKVLHSDVVDIPSDQFPVLKIAGGAPIPSFPNVDSNIYGISSKSIMDNLQSFQTDAPLCDVCGSLTERNGTCYRCRNCGNSMGCS